jgi:hypothetical protein
MIMNSIETKSRLHLYFFALGIFPVAAALLIHWTSKPLFGHKVEGPELILGAFAILLLAAMLLILWAFVSSRMLVFEATPAYENSGVEGKELDLVSLNAGRNAFVSIGVTLLFFVIWFFLAIQFDRAVQIILLCYGVLLSNAVCFFVLGFLVKGRLSNASR